MNIKPESVWNSPEKFLNYSCFLIYGQNYEKISNLINFLVGKLKEYPSNFKSIISFDNNDFKLNSGCIEESLRTIDIFGEKKILLVSLLNPDIYFKKIDFNDSEIFKDCKIIIKCRELNKKSKIRQLFENSKDLICTACYENTEADIKEQIIYKFESEGIKLDRNLLLMLMSYLKSQKNNLNNELEKIIIYIKKGELLTEKKLTLIVNPSTDFSLEEFTYNLVSGKIDRFDKLFYLMKKNSIDEISILTVLVKHFYKLLHYKMKLLETKSELLAIKFLYPPIFFKLKKEFLFQSDLWSIKSIEKILLKLLIAEKKIKTNSVYKEDYVKFLLFSICRLANTKKK